MEAEKLQLLRAIGLDWAGSLYAMREPPEKTSFSWKKKKPIETITKAGGVYAHGER